MIIPAMDASSDAAVGTIDHPNLQFWDMAYEVGEDIWTKEAVNQKLMEFHETLINGKSGLDVLVHVWKNPNHAVSCGERASCCWYRMVYKVAVKQFFEENKLEYTTQLCSIGGTDIPMYKAKDKAVTVYCGDFFLHSRSTSWVPLTVCLTMELLGVLSFKIHRGPCML